MANFTIFLFFTTSIIKNPGNKKFLSKIQKNFEKRDFTGTWGGKLARPISTVALLGLLESPFRVDSKSIKKTWWEQARFSGNEAPKIAGPSRLPKLKVAVLYLNHFQFGCR